MGVKPMADAMLGICVHDPLIALQPPSNVKYIASKSLEKSAIKASLSPHVKTAYYIAQGAKSMDLSQQQAEKDLPEQMDLFMKRHGLKKEKYKLLFFTDELRSDIKVLWSVAVRE